MKKIKFSLVLYAVVLSLVLGYATNSIDTDIFSIQESVDQPMNASDESDDNTIQVALLLDTSGSMNGLIEQTKSQLWNVLNELSRTQKNGEDIALEMALYEYGNPSKTKNSNQVNMLVPFTSDMDLISEKLFALKTSGGDEFCGTVIQSSLDELKWSEGNGLKVIYIAGNEAFTQGMISYKTACQSAVEKDVIVNTIFCGNYHEGQNTHWENGATAGGGVYLNINHNQETVYIKTPYDDKISDLNASLNKTYIPYGDKGISKYSSQTTEDLNSRSYGMSNMADRAVLKSSKLYKNTTWDLVDAYKKDKSVLKNAKVVDDTLQNISIEELERHIQEAAKQRTEIQNEIQELDKQRRKYKQENASTTQESTVQKQIIDSIRKQSKKKGFSIKE